MASTTRTLHLGTRTVRAAAWPAAGGGGWHWSVSVCRYVDTMLVATSDLPASDCEQALEEAVRVGTETVTLWWPDRSESAA